jgi:hypothetical protein
MTLLGFSNLQRFSIAFCDDRAGQRSLDWNATRRQQACRYSVERDRWVSDVISLPLLLAMLSARTASADWYSRSLPR